MVEASKYIIVAVVVIAVAAAGAYYVTTANPGGATTSIYYNTTNTTNTTSQTTRPFMNNNVITQSGPARNTIVAITDPHYAPEGSSTLRINYSAVQLYVASSSQSGWVDAHGNGSVEVFGPANSSRIIAYANISTNASIKYVRFSVTSANIDADGNKYGVSMMSPIVMANVTGNATGQTAAVVVDLRPVISATYDNNATSFVMFTAPRAAVAAGANITRISSLGFPLAISAGTIAALNSSAPSVVITNSSIKSVGNVTSLYLTLRDRSGSNLTISNVVLYGPITVKVQNLTRLSAQTITGIKALIRGNSSANAGPNVAAAASVGTNIKALQATTFYVSPTGQLSLEPNASLGGMYGGLATLAPGSNMTLWFNGTMQYDSGIFEGWAMGSSKYSVVAVGQNGAMASASMNAT